MYLLPLIVLILQTIWCSAEDETQVLIKDTPRKGDWICTRAGINFTEFLHETHCYVDKTLLLEKLFANETISNVLISIPPRWGKTLVLKQAEFFLALEVDATHSPISPQQTASHQFFTEGKISASGNYTEFKFAKPPLISKRSEFISKHLAQYQVVYLNFADFGPAKNYPKFYGNFKEAIGKIFENRLYVKHVFVKNLTDQLSASGNNDVETKLIQGLMDNLKQQFDAYLNREKATDEQWADSIVYFSKIIHQYFGKKVILLIDNIDYIVGMMSEMAPLGRSRSAQFLLNFFNKTVNEGCLYKIVATTTLPLVMNRITNNTVKDFVYLGNIGNELKPFIGFTESEFKQLSEPLKLESNLTDAAVQRYDGYFENTIYNPISVSHFLNKQQVDNYWVRENSAHVNELNIFPDSHLHEALKKLMSGLHYPYEAKRKLPIAFGYDKTAPPVSSLWIGEGASDPSITVANTELEEDFLLYLLAKGIATTYLEKKTVHVRIANEENKAVIRRRFPEL